MFCFCSVIIYLFGVLAAHQSEIDNNRKSSVAHQIKKSDNYDYYNNRKEQKSQTLDPSLRTIKYYAPRENPRLFYQSDSYLEEVNKKNLNRDVTHIYPGREVVKPEVFQHSHEYLKRNGMRLYDRTLSDHLCIKCPHDRTIIVEPGSDRVAFLFPTLYTCSNEKAPKEITFSTLYGPNFGSMLGLGSHRVIGRIFIRDKVHKMCKMQVHVIAQKCPIPRYLTSQCNKTQCSFSCIDFNLEIHGQTTLSCNGNRKWTGWSGSLPVCRPRSSCVHPVPPDHGHLSCKGSTTNNGTSLSEGSTCRVRCLRGWHWTPRAATVCRRGRWTYELKCQSKRYKPT